MEDRVCNGAPYFNEIKLINALTCVKIMLLSV